MVRGVKPSALPPGALWPHAGVQGMLGGAANHRGDGAGGAPPQGDTRTISVEAERGHGGPLLLQVADIVDLGEGPPGL